MKQMQTENTQKDLEIVKRFETDEGKLKWLSSRMETIFAATTKKCDAIKVLVDNFNINNKTSDEKLKTFQV